MSAFSAEVRFPMTGAAERRATDLQITQEEYRHDLAIYTVPRSEAQRVYRTGMPVVIAWGSGRERSDFFGYVLHTESADRSRVQVWCKGASQVLDNGSEYSFNHRTVPSVVSEVARLTGFDADVQTHGRFFGSLPMSGVIFSDLARHAQEIGHSFYAKNTRLVLHPRTALVDKNEGIAPVFSGPSLREFFPISGASQPGQSRAHRVLTGVDSRTGGRFRVTGGVARSRLGTTTYLPAGTRYLDEGVSTPEEARWKMDALAENERYSITARAVVDGSAQVHQTWPVLLDTVEDDYRGLWFVRKVVHDMSDGDYRMELELGKDAPGTTADLPDVRARRVLVTRNNPQGRPKAVYPPTILRGGQWQSQWSAASRTFRGVG